MAPLLQRSGIAGAMLSTYVSLVMLPAGDAPTVFTYLMSNTLSSCTYHPGFRN